MKILNLIPAIGLVVALTPVTARAATPQEIFSAEKCTKCHSISAAGIEKSKGKADDDDKDKDDDDDKDSKKNMDLSGAGIERDAAWIAKWLNKEVEVERNGKMKKHKKKWKGSDEDLKILSTYLGTLKTEVKK